MNFLSASLNSGSALLLILSVAVVGVLHTIVPDHWVPITLIARERKWTKGQTARAAFTAGTGHVVTTLILGALVWLAGVAVATRFGHYVDLVSSFALIAFGVWIAVSSLREMRTGHGHGHIHSHEFEYLEGSIHGPELQSIETPGGALSISIFEYEMPPHFRVSGISADACTVRTVREGNVTHVFNMVNQGDYWQSSESIPEPHEFKVNVSVTCAGITQTYGVKFAKHSHDHAPVKSSKNTRTALLLILGSSPMIEGIPAFFAAGKYGFGVIIIMAIVFAMATISTYVILCVSSFSGLSRLNMSAFEKYGEVISGAFIALIGLVFLQFPVL